MNKVNIQFGGMTMVPDDSVSRDGSMAVLLNAEMKNGEVVPRTDPVKVPNPGVKKAVYHNGSKAFLELTENGVLYTTEDHVHKTALWEGVLTVQDFDVLGNILVIKGKEIDSGVEGMFYAIWRNLNYEYLGALPDVPEMTLKCTNTLETVETETAYDETFNKDFNSTKKWVKNSKGYFDKCLDKHYNAGRFIDNVLFIVCLKLFDGSYKNSYLYAVRGSGTATFDTDTIGYGVENFRSTDVTAETQASARKKVGVLGFSVERSFNFDLTKWRDVITSVDVYSSGSIIEHKVVRDKVFLFQYSEGAQVPYDSGEADMYTQKSIPELREEVEQFSSFHKIAELNLKGEELKNITNTSPSNLAVQNLLEGKDVKNLLYNETMVYNSRMHIFDYTENPRISGSAMYNNPVKTNVKTEEANSSLKFENDRIMTYKTNIPVAPQADGTYVLSHPCNGLKEQKIVGTNNSIKANFVDNYHTGMSVYLPSHNEVEYYVSYNFIGLDNYKHKSKNDKGEDVLTGFNFRFSISEFINKIKQDVVKGYYKFQIGDNGWYLDDKQINENDYGFGCYGYTGTTLHVYVERRKSYASWIPIEDNYSGSIDKENEIKEDVKNILKVSDVDNPFYFPTAQTYKFDGDIVGVASNAEAVSAGQFGAYPLFVFTTNGVWAMQVDTSGKGAYLTSTPVARDRCNGSVCPFSGGIAFTTDRGVMVISGGQVTELSGALDGLTHEVFNFSGELLSKIYEKASRGLIKPVQIREYVKGAVLAYDYVRNELLLSNSDYSYSYVYGLASQCWSMIDTTFDVVAKNTNDLIVYDADCMYTFTEELDSHVVAITRPIKVDTLDFKRLRQAALRCTFDGQFNFYVLGSNDGANFVCITGKEYPSKNGGEPTNVTRRDLITSMARSKQYKYIAIAFAGSMRGRVSFAELLVDAGFASNQLR